MLCWVNPSKSSKTISELVHLSLEATRSSNNNLSNWLVSMADNTSAFSLPEKSRGHHICHWISCEEHQKIIKRHYSYFLKRFVEKLGIESRLPDCFYGALCTRSACLLKLNVLFFLYLTVLSLVVICLLYVLSCPHEDCWNRNTKDFARYYFF